MGGPTSESLGVGRFSLDTVMLFVSQDSNIITVLPSNFSRRGPQQLSLDSLCLKKDISISSIKSGREGGIVWRKGRERM